MRHISTLLTRDREPDSFFLSGAPSVRSESRTDAIHHGDLVRGAPAVDITYRLDGASAIVSRDTYLVGEHDVTHVPHSPLANCSPAY